MIEVGIIYRAITHQDKVRTEVNLISSKVERFFMKTLYTGHTNLGEHEVYSFIYAESWAEAEEYLTVLLNCYLRQYHNPLPHVLPQIKIVSRPDGWVAPDGYMLPATSKQYALKYPQQEISTPTMTTTSQESDEIDAILEEEELLAFLALNRSTNKNATM